MNVAGVAAYALGVALVLAASGWLMERALTTLRLPVRWVWMGALGLTVWLPLASLVADPQERVRATAARVTEGVAPSTQGELREATTGGGDAEERWGLALLGDWRTATNRALASGAALLPVAGPAPAWIAGAWGASSILVAILLVGSLLRLSRRAKRWPEELLLGRRVKISPDLGPATVGLLAPLIVIPRWAKELSTEELDLVLRHEAEHVRSRDTLVLGLALVAVVACPWNPVVWWQLRRLKAAVEVDCDRRILRRGVAAAGYGNLLVRVGTRGRLLSLAVPTITGSTSLLERRLTIMKNTHARTSLPTALAPMTAALVLAFVACSTDAPVATEREVEGGPTAAADAQAASETQADDVVALWVDRDGTVQVNDVVQPVSRISEVLGSLDPKRSVVSLEAHQAVAYRAVSEVQEQLQAAGLIRVVFTRVESGAQRAPQRDVPTLLDAGLAVVLPETNSPDLRIVDIREVAARNPGNILFLEVMPAGIVRTRLGADPSVREIAPAEVEALWRQEVASNPRLIALLETRPDAEYRHMYDVLAALQRAEATRFSIIMAE